MEARTSFRSLAVELRAAADEVWKQLRRHGRWWFVVAVLTWLACRAAASLGPAAFLAALLVAFFAWSRLAPRSYRSMIGRPIWRRRRWLDLREMWPSLMDACKLTRHISGQKGQTVIATPRLGRRRWNGAQLTVFLRLPVGHTVEDIQAVSERLRHAIGARMIRVSSEPRASVMFTFGDPLADTITRSQPDPADEWDGRSVPMGLTAEGEAWSLRLTGTHTLVAGMTGSGKASLVWGVTLGLAPAISQRLVQVHGIDLKGGMELGMGRGLFARYATHAEEAVIVLEDAVAQMQARVSRLAGVTRQHHPTTDEPQVVVLIDEVAALTSYLTDRTLKSRAKEAMSILCSQGRAVGFTVVACLQDPRKETLPNRGLFPQMVGLRLRDREETSMVLGDGAVASGAQCHRLPAATPGVGYVVPEDGGDPVRVRAAYVSDELIKWTAANLPSPISIPVEMPSDTEDADSGSADSDSATATRARKPRQSRRKKKESAS